MTRLGGGGLRRWLATLVALALCLTLAGCSLSTSEPKPEPPSTAPTSTATPTPADLETAEIKQERPNIVLVQVDDMSMELLPTLASVARMQSQGATYPNSFVVDSLCCVSRASLFTGQFPHQTGVLTNTSSTTSEPGDDGSTETLGGWPAFVDNHNEVRSFNVTLQQAGYETGFVGKYLNEYEYRPDLGQLPPVPPGWDRFNVVYGSAYDGWGFDLLAGEDQALTHVDVPSYSATDQEKDAAYAGTVIAEQALDFITKHRDDDRPFYLHVAPYAPHNRTNAQGAWPDEPLFPAAFADRKTAAHPGNCGPIACHKLTAKTLPGFNQQAKRGPVTLQGKPTRDWNVDSSGEGPTGMGPVRAADLLRQRAQMLQSVDRMLSDILDAVDDNTFVIFTSDNGLHMNQAGLGFGKGTAYRSDIQVPLVVVGPGVKPGSRDEIALNIDLSATLEDLAGVAPVAFRAGQSLLPSLTDPAVSRRGAAIIEHTAQSLGRDPDQIFTGGELAKIPSYVAVRTPDALLIRSDLDPRFDETELGYQYFSYRDQAFEGANTFARDRRTPAVRHLLDILKTWDDCQSETGSTPFPQRCREVLHTR